MHNLGRLKKIFADELTVDANEIRDELVYGELGWDSIAHMGIVAGIETVFDIQIAVSEALELIDFRSAMLIIEDHGVEFV